MSLEREPLLILHALYVVVALGPQFCLRSYKAKAIAHTVLAVTLLVVMTFVEPFRTSSREPDNVLWAVCMPVFLLGALLAPELQVRRQLRDSLSASPGRHESDGLDQGRVQ
jgi:hypothetical protein